MQNDLAAWLQERLPENQIGYKEGIAYLPIDVCERKLDQMQGMFDVTWHTRNYKSQLVTSSGEMWISASLELVITGEGWYKSLVGCSTFRAATMMPNTHLDATAKSFCVVNASMDLGDQFGRFLSLQNAPIITTDIVKQKLKPDIIVLRQLELAMKENAHEKIEQLERLYDIKIGDKPNA